MNKSTEQHRRKRAMEVQGRPNESSSRQWPKGPGREVQDEHIFAICDQRWASRELLMRDIS